VLGGIQINLGSPALDRFLPLCAIHFSLAFSLSFPPHLFALFPL
jgi:hypothetical protein